MSLVDSGAEGIILGCTEIGLLVKQEDSEVPFFLDKQKEIAFLIFFLKDKM